MKVMRKVVFDRATMLVSSNALETYELWSAGATYALGARVRHTDYNVYQSLQAANTGNTPGSIDSTAWWVLVGPENRQAMFDDQIETQTTAEGVLNVTVKTGAVDSIFVGNVEANTVSITLRDGLGGPVVYQEERNLTNEYVLDWYQYFFWDPTFRRTQEVFTGLPIFADSHLTLSLDGGSSTVSVGVLVFGRMFDVGETSNGAGAGITDYSRIEQDQFGKTLFNRRGYSKKLSCTVLVQNAQLNRVQRLLYDLRATPTVWVGSTDPQLSEALVLFGFYADFTMLLEYPRHSLCNLEIKGLK